MTTTATLQPSLFDAPATGDLETPRKWAQFSDCRLYRYALGRTWDASPDRDYAIFIGLNPSTADENTDDPTIRRCVGFAKSWGCGGIIMVNLFAFRATEPAVMMAAPDPVGPHNDSYLTRYACMRGYTVAAWGASGGFRGRDRDVRRLLAGHTLRCLGTTKGGQPRHPLYVAGATTLEVMA